MNIAVIFLSIGLLSAAVNMFLLDRRLRRVEQYLTVKEKS